ncbi:MAG TPA: hypothetical protein VM534_03440 [Thermoanaerobaculia bacterium]|nr:hypothetical protein [Thermoanaerobaculia bacterium]
MWALIAILLILVLAGLLTSMTLGGWIYLIPVVAALLAVYWLFAGRRRR